MNFLAASDTPLRLDKKKLTQMLLNYTMDGKPLIANPAAPDVRKELDQISSEIDRAERGDSLGMFEYDASVRSSVRGARVVTDDNMAVEWHQDLTTN